ncbi:MAG TPA: hypothetical protein VKO38_02710 [Wenzhouxiangella sp.]|nr:hypothetical protein [Wenzhouxiangella sp.]
MRRIARDQFDIGSDWETAAIGVGVLFVAMECGVSLHRQWMTSTRS